MRYCKSIILLAVVLIPICAYTIDFDELDLPPAGVHRGQMLLGFFSTAGFAGGSIIDAENDFIKNSTFTFENETTKLIELSHLPLSIGIFFEYIPIDYIGVQCKLRRSWVIQRTTFGTEYANRRETLFANYAMLFSLSFHATNRKQWDVSISPIIGYSLYSMHAAPVAEALIENTASEKREGKSVAYGIEACATAYFSGGLFITAGYEWLKYSIKFSESFNITNDQTGALYANFQEGDIFTHSIIIIVGYAFSN